MRPQQNRRMRGRGNNNNNKRGPNPLMRNYESNGPDVKVRGNAQNIADKYATLARDAQGSGDRVIAENYLQHAEHYNRIILAAQAQQQQSAARDDDDSDSARSNKPGRAREDGGQTADSDSARSNKQGRAREDGGQTADSDSADSKTNNSQDNASQGMREEKTTQDSSQGLAQTLSPGRDAAKSDDGEKSERKNAPRTPRRRVAKKTYNAQAHEQTSETAAVDGSADNDSELKTAKKTAEQAKVSTEDQLDQESTASEKSPQKAFKKNRLKLVSNEDETAGAEQTDMPLEEGNVAEDKRRGGRKSKVAAD